MKLSVQSDRLNLLWFIMTIALVIVFVWAVWYKTKSFPKPVDIVRKSQTAPKEKIRKTEREMVEQQTKPSAPVQKQVEATELAQEPEPAHDADRLIDDLYIGVFDLKDKALVDIDRNIQLSDALIQKEPNLYSAYKTKLLSLLIRELKFEQPVEIETYESLYDDLLSFRGLNERDEILIEKKLLMNQSDELLESTELEGIDTDLIHVPFLRLSAIGDLPGLASTSQEYIAAYPNSYIGYMYLAEAFWKQGDKASAINAFKGGFGDKVSDEAAFEILSQIESKSAIDRISEMPLFQ